MPNSATPRTINPRNITDHAGGYYEWFAYISIAVNGNLTLTSNPDVTGEPAITTTLTPAELYDVVDRIHETKNFDDYEAAFLSDLLKGNTDDADGDSNIVDTILQWALFGGAVFA